MTNGCILHGDAWCSCRPEKEPTSGEIKKKAQKLVEAVKAAERRKKETTYFGGMKYFNHPRLGARPNRRLPGVDKWQESDQSKGEQP